ncbi:MAG: hypothetical protein NC212_08965 [Staphylococcus sp.]|nr:hypothetical protein [Staphylococcus sp.]
MTPEVMTEGVTPIVIPDSVSKPPEQFNYIGNRGKRAVQEAVKDLFLRSLWSDISPLRDSPVGLNALIAAWCESHGIEIDQIETVRQCYYRLRNSYGSRGINLRKSSRKS